MTTLNVRLVKMAPSQSINDAVESGEGDDDSVRNRSNEAAKEMI